MKRILIVSNSLWNINQFRKNLIINLLNNDYKILIISPNCEKIKLEINNINLSYKQIDFSPNSYFNIKDLFFIINYRKILFSFKPHYVLSFTVKPNIICSFLSRFYNYRNISNITGLGTLFLRGILIEWISIIIYKIAFSKIYYVLFHNTYDRSFFIKKNITSNEKSSIILGSGVDLNFFYYSRKNYENLNQVNFLYIGRIIKDKGISELLDAIKILRNQNYKAKFKFIGILKESDKTLSDKFNKFISLGLINYCGNVKSVRKFIIESDCIILPSYREGLSKSLLEASAVGRPMLVSNVPGCKDIVSDGFNGFLFEPKNSISLSKAIIKFIETPALLKNTMSINAYKNSHKFDEKYIIDKYNKLII